MRILTVIGNRPQFVKAAAVSRLLRERARGADRPHRASTTTTSCRGSSSRSSACRRPTVELGAGSGTNTEQTARMLAALEPVLARARARTWCSSTATPTRRSPARSRPRRRGCRSPTSRPACARSTARCPRSSTASSPTTRATCCSARPRRPSTNLEREAVGGRGPPGRRRDGRRLARLRADRRGALAPRSPTSGSSRAATCWSPRTAPGNVDDPARLERLVGAARRRCPAPVVFPLHPRTRARLEEAGLRGRLEAAASVSSPRRSATSTSSSSPRHARAVLTDSGGVQKEAYLLGVPCVTLRDTTEWVETVEAGWNVLVDLDRDAALAALERPRPPASGPSSTAADSAGERIRDVARCLHSAADEDRDHRRSATSACRWPSRSPRRATTWSASTSTSAAWPRCQRGESYIEDVPSERLAAVGERLHRLHPLRRPRRLRRGPDRGADPADRKPRAGPRPAARRGHLARRRAARRPARRARVDHLPGHHARAARPAARGVGPRGRARTSTSRSRPSGSTRAAPTTRCATRRRSSAA